MEQPSLAERLRELVDGHRSANAFATSVGISASLLRKYLSGSIPGADIAAKIAARSGVRLEWLILGEGPKFPPSQAQAQAHGMMAAAGIDAELLGRVVDRVAKVYRDLGVTLPDVDLGRLSAEKYVEIREFAADPDEWPPALDLMAVRLRKALLQAAAEPGSTKSRA